MYHRSVFCLITTNYCLRCRGGLPFCEKFEGVQQTRKTRKEVVDKDVLYLELKLGDTVDDSR